MQHCIVIQIHLVCVGFNLIIIHPLQPPLIQFAYFFLRISESFIYIPIGVTTQKVLLLNTIF